MNKKQTFLRREGALSHLKYHTVGVYSYYLVLDSDEYNSVSEEEGGTSRAQMWNKYPLDVQKEFGYDSSHDLDSDWWFCDVHEVLSQALEDSVTAASAVLEMSFLA